MSPSFVLGTPQIAAKLQLLDTQLHRLLCGQSDGFEAIPVEPAREVCVVRNTELPPKPGLSTAQGQGRLLHDLANIELQAMELGLRTLIEFPHAPREFREELAEITRAEGAHLRLCLDALEAVGGHWGQWPVHTGLWAAVSSDDTLIARVLTVHRHLEGSGLDAGDSILRRLSGVDNKAASQTVKRIFIEEIDHVAFGSRWFRALCRAENLDPDAEFRARMPEIGRRSPRKDRLAWGARERAGFTGEELALLEELQLALPGYAPKTLKPLAGT